MSLALSLVLAAALAIAAYAGAAVMLAVVLTIQVLLAATWHSGVGAPGGWGGGALALASGAACSLIAFGDGAQRPLARATAVLGAATVGIFVHQLLRRDRQRAVVSMTATGSLVLFAVLPALYLPLQARAPDGAFVAVAMSAVVAARLSERPARSSRAHAVLGVAAGVVVGTAGGAVTSVGPIVGAGLGAGCGVATFLAGLLVRQAARPEPWLRAAVPFAFAGFIAFLVALGGAI